MKVAFVRSTDTNLLPYSLINIFTNSSLLIFLQNFTCLKIMETHAGSMISWLKFHKPCHDGIFGMIDFAKVP